MANLLIGIFIGNIIGFIICGILSANKIEEINSIRNKTIDEFTEAIKIRLLKFIPTDFDDIEYIAKCLKEKNNNIME